MSTIFGFFFFIILIVLIIGFSLLSGILRLIFGFGRKPESHNRQQQGSNTYTNQSRQEGKSYRQETSSKAQNRKKIFDDDEGEYVDFEEVKDDK